MCVRTAPARSDVFDCRCVFLCLRVSLRAYERVGAFASVSETYATSMRAYICGGLSA